MNRNDVIIMLKTIKPTLSETTLNTYARILYNMWGILFDGPFNLETIRNTPTEHMLSFCRADASVSTLRNFASALHLVSPRDELKAYINNLNNISSSRLASGMPTPREIENRIQQCDIDATELRLRPVYDLCRDVYIHAGKEALSRLEIEQIRNYTLWSLINGKHIAPRRSKDWIHFKLRNVSPNDNYLDADGVLVFRQYKTSGTYGEQHVACPQYIIKLLQQYAIISPHEYLVTMDNGEQISGPRFTMLVNSLSGHTSGHGTNQYRHYYLQNKFGDGVLGLDETMASMGSSPAVISSYIKHF